jgi:ABC-type polysaccharide/polyol phosphate transport system ATPase subunit
MVLSLIGRRAYPLRIRRSWLSNDRSRKPAGLSAGCSRKHVLRDVNLQISQSDKIAFLGATVTENPR